MPSFDIVSKTDMTSVDNALQGVAKEMQVRYDFKGSKSEVSKNDDVITILADDELKRRQVEELVDHASHSERRRYKGAGIWQAGTSGWQYGAPSSSGQTRRATRGGTKNCESHQIIKVENASGHSRR